MPHATIRISDRSRNTLRELAAQNGSSMQMILDQAIEAYRRRLFLEKINSAYEAVRQNEDAWGQLKDEMTEFDATIGDGLQAGDSRTEDDSTPRQNSKKPT